MWRKHNSATEQNYDPEAETKAVPAAASGVQTMTRTEDFFYSVYSVHLDRLKFPAIGSLSIITVVFFIFAVQLEPAEDAARVQLSTPGLAIPLAL